MYVDISGWAVMLIGMGIVFFGLICLIAIIYFMGFCYSSFSKKKKAVETAAASNTATPAMPMPAANRQQFVAAVACAVAVQMGTEPDGLRIHSIRQV